MMGLPGGEGRVSSYQNLRTNGLITLDQFQLHEAEKMMNSKEWTRAIFLREPKERVLSAFLNKFVNDKSYFRNKCCGDDKLLLGKKDQHHCDKMMNTRNLTYFLHRTLDCHDPHWLPQWPVIEEKFWKKITFIGFMELVSSDAKTLLESLSSSSDGKNSTAWETHGKNEWGKNHNEGFMQRNAAGHSANAAERLCQIVKPEDETFVEEHWHMEWEHRE